MKKTLLVLLLVVVSMTSVNAQGGYRGFFEVSPNIGGTGFGLDVTTTHGWQFNDKYYLGIGAGVVNLFKPYSWDSYNVDEREDGLKYEEKDQTESLPLFIKFRYDKLGVNQWTPFFEAKLGYCVVCDYGSPLYAGINVGARCAITERIGLNFGVGLSVTPRNKWQEYRYYSFDDGYTNVDYDYSEKESSAINFAVTVGVDF